MPSGVYKRTEKYYASLKLAHNRSEVRARKSAVMKKYYENPKNKEKNRNAQKIAQNRPEVKAKRSISAKIIQNKPEVKVKKSASGKIAQNRPEVRAKRSASMKAIHADPTSAYNSEEYRVKQRASQRIAQNRPEVKAKQGVATKRRWEDPNYRERTLKAIFRGFKLKPNKPEKQLDKLLQKLFPNQWKYVGDGSFLIGFKNPDFINITEQKKIIELFGDYWHSQEATMRTREEEEQQRMDHFGKYGYQTLIIWEHELGDTTLLERRIMEFHNS